MERLCPDAEILWFGSAQDVGLGSASEQGLIRKIKARAVDIGEDGVRTDVTSGTSKDQSVGNACKVGTNHNGIAEYADV